MGTTEDYVNKVRFEPLVWPCAILFLVCLGLVVGLCNVLATNKDLQRDLEKARDEAGTWEADYEECQNWAARSKYSIMSQELFDPDGLQCVWIKPGAQAWIDPMKARADDHSWAPDHPSRGQDVLMMYGILNFSYDEEMVAVVTSELADDQFYSDGFYTLLWYSIDDVELAGTCPPNWPER